VQIFYPITVCYPPDFINGVESVYEAADDQPSIQLQRSAFREYRLSSFAGKRLHRPMWCRRHSGPWVAAITENIDCSNNSHFELTILGIGSNVHYSWWGALEDVPSEISVVGEFNLKGSYRTPCGSLSTCN